MSRAALKAGLEGVRLIGGNINGSYTLSQNGAFRAFACRAQSVSPRQMALAAPVSGAVGENVAMHFDPFGLLRGRIMRRLEFGFVVEIVADDEERARVAARIHWLKQHVSQKAPDQRGYKRQLPRNPRSSLVLSNGRTLDCFIINMSPSGVALSADFSPGLGEPLAVGRAVGRVVRLLELGFAVQFVRPVDPADLEHALKRIA